MKLKELNPPIIQLPANQVFHRIQLLRPRKTSIKINGLLLAPAGLLASRFDLVGEPTAYLADSPETALYESLFRREVKSLSIDELKRRSLATFHSTRTLLLADLSSLSEPYPLLQATRIGITQALAQELRDQAADGVIYASAQHPQHSCICLFESGARALKRVSELALSHPGTDRLLTVVVEAARRSGVPLLPSAEMD